MWGWMRPGVRRLADRPPREPVSTLVLRTSMHRRPASPSCVGRDPGLHHRPPAVLLSTPAACPCLCVDGAALAAPHTCPGHLPGLSVPPVSQACASHSSHPAHLQLTTHWVCGSPDPPGRAGPSRGSESGSDVVSSSNPQGVSLTDALGWCHFSARC